MAAQIVLRVRFSTSSSFFVEIGNGEQALVVDDFLENPEEVVTAARSQKDHLENYFPGGNVLRVPLDSTQVTQYLREHYPSCAEDLEIGRGYLMEYEVEDDSNAYFRIPHIDMNDFVYLIYLNRKEEYEGGGLGFFRNTVLAIDALGKDADHESTKLGRSLGITKPDQFVGFAQKFATSWDRTAFVPVKYNRLVVFNSMVFHKPITSLDPGSNRLMIRGLGQSRSFAETMTKTWQCGHLVDSWINRVGRV